MANPVEICSSALVLIGDTKITAFDESDGGEAAEIIYPATKAELLVLYPWSFATEDVDLVRLTATPNESSGYEYYHQLPSGMLRLWELYGVRDYDIQRGRILSHFKDLTAKCIFDAPENDFTPAFRTAIEYLIAAKIGTSVTENSTTAKTWLERYDRQIIIAKHIDATQRPPVPIQDAPFNDIR